MISLKIAAHRGILGGYLCKELRLYVLGRAPIFFFFFPPQFDTSNGNQYLLLFHRAQLNYDKVKGRKDIMILLICVVTTLIELVLVANAF